MEGEGGANAGEKIAARDYLRDVSSVLDQASEIAQPAGIYREIGRLTQELPRVDLLGTQKMALAYVLSNISKALSDDRMMQLGSSKSSI